MKKEHTKLWHWIDRLLNGVLTKKEEEAEAIRKWIEELDRRLYVHTEEKFKPLVNNVFLSNDLVGTVVKVETSRFSCKLTLSVGPATLDRQKRKLQELVIELENKEPWKIEKFDGTVRGVIYPNHPKEWATVELLGCFVSAVDVPHQELTVVVSHSPPVVFHTSPYCLESEV